MKKIFIALFLVILSLFTIVSVNAEGERYFTSLPAFTASSFTNNGHNCSMQKELSTLNSADSNNSLKLVKNQSTNFGIASVYYQNLGTAIAALGEAEYVGMALTIYNETSITNGGLLFKYNAQEITNIEAYTPEDELLQSRNLDYTGYRTYIVPFESIEPLSIGEFEIGIWGYDAATIYISKMQLVHSTEIVGGNPIEPDPTPTNPLPSYSYLVNGFNDNTEISKFGISGTPGTNYSISLNSNTEYVSEGNGSLNYKWKHTSTDFAYSEIYIDLQALIEETVDSNLKGISFDLFNVNPMQLGIVGFWLKATEVDGSEYEASYEYIEGGTGLAHEGKREVYVPFSSFTLLQSSYSADENSRFDVEQTKYIKIGLWSNTNLEVDVDLYIDNFKLLADNDIDIEEEPEIPTPEPSGPSVEFEKAPAYSYLLSGFEPSDLSDWGISGTSGTVYTINPVTDKVYVKEGEHSLHYQWSNELYSFGYTEIYMNISESIELFGDCNLKGISFWIYVAEEETVGEVGFWLKASEKDNSEYEASYALIEGGTGLGTVGWRKVYVPFSSFVIEQTYALDENGQLDIDQLAYIKIGLWSNQPDLVNVDIYIDDLRLMAESEMVEQSSPVNPNQPGQSQNNKNDNTGVIIALVIAGVVLVGGAVTFLVIKKKSKK